MSIRPPLGVYLMEFDTIFIITWSIRSRSAKISTLMNKEGPGLAIRLELNIEGPGDGK